MACASTPSRCGGRPGDRADRHRRRAVWRHLESKCPPCAARARSLRMRSAGPAGTWTKSPCSSPMTPPTISWNWRRCGPTSRPPLSKAEAHGWTKRRSGPRSRGRGQLADPGCAAGPRPRRSRAGSDPPNGARTCQTFRCGRWRPAPSAARSAPEREGVPALDLPHRHLPLLRPGRQGRRPLRHGRLRLQDRGTGRDPLPQGRRPALAEHAPGGRATTCSTWAPSSPSAGSHPTCTC